MSVTSTTSPVRESRTLSVSVTTVFDPPLIMSEETARSRYNPDYIRGGDQPRYLVSTVVKKQAIESISYSKTHDALDPILKEVTPANVGSEFGKGYNLLKNGSKGADNRYSSWAIKPQRLSEADKVRYETARISAARDITNALSEARAERGI